MMLQTNFDLAQDFMSLQPDQSGSDLDFDAPFINLDENDPLGLNIINLPDVHEEYPRHPLPNIPGPPSCNEEEDLEESFSIECDKECEEKTNDISCETTGIMKKGEVSEEKQGMELQLEEPAFSGAMAVQKNEKILID
mmetsp:Transcript_22034/g.18891  ORF Transcript_22034/g.18891 Transcript_22034/m.18891 type:complete len:138 (-) Transcript_22034:287-700(-)|eukprot:CAMPEP_0114591250 /NCGR_PEP_ID=MMETSP0125-20121206/13345_1 /TAXON_ID=485358 ORGANISM="Aristerostoma sp., Strain ATCC 50986" /NCGR_SAMPLE_ID=MMETSP0125 /ASSEMBLY_ACC=CAM_ASM_000245 /LENGTH=137 /DNA_ID=CAMNT_0001789243 /DNA_START=58 /DNA_END=471 /DNA_ORIENTATION=+